MTRVLPCSTMLALVVAALLPGLPAWAAGGGPHVTAEYQLPPNGNLGAVVAGPDAHEWVAGDSLISRVSGAGQITNYAAAADGSSICVGPDGALWFGAKGTGNLGRITTAGQIGYVAIPPPAGSRFIPLILGITTGSDGALWMTDFSNAEVIRYVPGGQPSYVKLGSGALPYGIVNGPDGALWVADEAPRVDRVALDGSVTSIGLPGFYATRSITVGGDGNLWVNNSNGGLGRVTPGGQVSAFAVTSLTGQPADVQFVAADRGGHIWFSAWYAYPVEALGIADTSGRSELVRVPTVGNGAYALGQGPAGPAMWFTEAFTSKVGMAAP